MAKKVQFTTNQPSATTDYLAADNTWKTMSGGGGGSPTGAAGGDLAGTYPNPTVDGIHGVDMQSGTPNADEVWIYGGSPAKWQHQKLHASQTTNDSTVTGTNVDDALDHLDSTKQATITGAATTVVSSNLTPSRVVVSNGGGKLDVAVTTTTEIGYVNGVTSNIQTQLDSKISSSAIIQNNVIAQALAGAASPVTRYHSVAGTISTLTTAFQIPVPTACNFLNFYFRIYSAQPASGSLVLTLQKNAVDTSLAITIASGSAIGNYTNTNTVAFSAGDTWQVKIVQNATSGSTNLGGYSFKINGI